MQHQRVMISAICSADWSVKNLATLVGVTSLPDLYIRSTDHRSGRWCPTECASQRNLRLSFIHAEGE